MTELTHQQQGAVAYLQKQDKDILQTYRDLYDRDTQQTTKQKRSSFIFCEVVGPMP